MVREIAALTSFERMREKVSEIEAADDSTLVNTGPNSYDPETMLYRRHMADGRTGKGRNKFTPAQLARLDALVQKFSML